MPILNWLGKDKVINHQVVWQKGTSLDARKRISTGRDYVIMANIPNDCVL